MKITFNYEYYEILCEIVFGFNTKSTRYKIDYLDENKKHTSLYLVGLLEKSKMDTCNE